MKIMWLVYRFERETPKKSDETMGTLVKLADLIVSNAILGSQYLYYGIQMEGFLYLAMVIAGAFLMLNAGVGPFAHARFLHLAERFSTLTINRRRIIVVTAWMIVIVGVTHVMGIWTLETWVSQLPMQPNL